jgi:hypothetical protein
VQTEFPQCSEWFLCAVLPRSPAPLLPYLLNLITRMLSTCLDLWTKRKITF